MGAPREISGGASLTLATALVPGPDISRNVISGVTRGLCQGGKT